MNSKPILNILLPFFLFVSVFATSQEIYEHEKEIAKNEMYLFREINFKVADKKDSIQLSGTLIYPKGIFEKVIIIVPGSGADTRNSHFVLTEALLNNNIAVYRYDERGIGKSGGAYNKANYTITMMGDELAACIKKLRESEVISGKKLGLLGHSQGGMVTMEAYTKNVPVDFLIQWGTPVQKHGKFLEYQLMCGQNTFDDVLKYDTQQKKLEVMTYLHKVVEDNKDLESWPLSKKIDKAAKKIKYGKDHYTRFPYLTLASEKDIVRKDFENSYKEINIPVLYIIGTNDSFVDPVAETRLLESFGNANITIRKMENLSHYLTSGKLTLENLYSIDDTAVNVILEWLNNSLSG